MHIFCEKRQSMLRMKRSTLQFADHLAKTRFIVLVIDFGVSVSVLVEI